MGRPINIHKFGGPVSKAGSQLSVKANLSGTPNVTAGLNKQKKQRTFQVVTGAGATALCTFVDKVGADLLVGEMSLKVTPSSGPAFFIKRITNRFIWDFNNVRYMWAFSGAGKIIADQG
jgi:hypothetical protein